MARKKQKPIIIPKISSGKPAEKITPTYSLINFFQKNFLLIVVGIVLILLAGGGLFFWNIFNKRAEEKASNLFYQAYVSYKAAKTQSKDWEEPMNLFAKITQDYPRTRAAGLSFFYLGNCQFNLKKFDEAIKSYNQFLSRFSAQPQLAILAYDSLGYCYEEEKNYQKAL
ncbi:MAG: tetratricopeptide repeat protein, partial [Desulfobacterota bacterium]|nr:tetratricopeptide repeat protein [Thermodesulfobacteriota bacterium]